MSVVTLRMFTFKPELASKAEENSNLAVKTQYFVFLEHKKKD